MNKPPIREVLEHYGAEFVPTKLGWGKMKCPFHEDRSASASVNTDEGLFRCFACQIDSPLSNGGSAVDGFDIIAWKEGLTDFPSTKQFAEELLGESYGSVLPSASGQPSRRVFGESRPVRGQRSAFQTRVRRRAFDRT